MDEYISLVRCYDAGYPLLNMNVQLAYQQTQPQRSSEVVAAVDPVEQTRILLSEFNQSVEPDDSLIKRTAI